VTNSPLFKLRKEKNTNTYTKRTKPKPTGPSPPVRTAHVSVHAQFCTCGAEIK